MDEDEDEDANDQKKSAREESEKKELGHTLDCALRWICLSGL